MSTFAELPAEERAYWHDRIRDETGQEMYDLPADERAAWSNRAVGDAEERGWMWPE